MVDLRDIFKDGVVPPYQGTTPAGRPGRSPYRIGLSALVAASSFTPERIAILEGFLSFRHHLKAKGLQGFQWVDGSFVEDVENGDRNRPPSDIDLVTWVYVPDGLELESFGEWFGEIAALHQLLGPKENFKCDAYLVPMMSNGLVDMNEAIYWSGLFSHSRDGETWKGFFQVELADDENEAMMILEEVAK